MVGSKEQHLNASQNRSAFRLQYQIVKYQQVQQLYKLSVECHNIKHNSYLKQRFEMFITFGCSGGGGSGTSESHSELRSSLEASP